MSGETKSKAIGDEKVVRALGEPVCVVTFHSDGRMEAYHVASKVASVENKRGFLIYQLQDGKGAIAIGKPKEPKGLVYSYVRVESIASGVGPEETPMTGDPEKKRPVAFSFIGPEDDDFPF